MNSYTIQALEGMVLQRFPKTTASRRWIMDEFFSSDG